MARVINPRSLLQHNAALVALSRYAVQQNVGGMLTAATEMLAKVLGCKGVIAYRAEKRELVLAAEQGLPRRAKPWLARLPREGERWFVGQDAVKSLKVETAGIESRGRKGNSVQPILHKEGWRHMAAAPVVSGRQLYGAVVVGVASKDELNKSVLSLLEAAGVIMGMALQREDDAHKQREQRVQDAKTAQLATVGLLAATVASDLAQPLGSMQMQMEDQEDLVAALQERLPEDPAIAELVSVTSDLSATLARTRVVMQRLLTYMTESPPEVIDLAEVVQDACALLRENIEGRGILLGLAGIDESLAARGRRENLHMMVVQLLLYAAEECESSRVVDPSVHVRLQRDGLRHVLIVESNGKGGSELSTSAIFDAFFTHARGGRITSFGLALARQTVLAHQGHIEVGRSSLGGLMLRVVLPASEAALPRERRYSTRPVRRSDPGSGPRPVVLWVDDDDLFVRDLRRHIDTHNFRSVRSVQKARRVLAELEEAPVLIFCALQLQDGSGKDLHEQVGGALREKFVFLTGGVVPAAMASYVLASGCPTVIKPLAVEEVADLLDLPRRKRRHSASIAPTLSDEPRSDEPLSDESLDAFDRHERSLDDAHLINRERSASMPEMPAVDATKTPSGVRTARQPFGAQSDTGFHDEDEFGESAAPAPLAAGVVGDLHDAGAIMDADDSAPPLPSDPKGGAKKSATPDAKGDAEDAAAAEAVEDAEVVDLGAFDEDGDRISTLPTDVDEIDLTDG